MGNSSNVSTLVALLQRRAHSLPDQRAYTILTERETDSIHLTYGQLDREARAIGARLQSVLAAGERVLLLYPDGLEYVTAFFGCLYAGAVPIPVYPPRLNRANPRIQAIATDAQARIALTTTSIAARLDVRRQHTPGLEGIRCLGTTYPEPSTDAGHWQEPPLTGASVAYIQYTSGSTATPRGVVLSHSNLLHNLAHLQDAFRIRPEGMGVSWLPLYHDMGLIGGVLLALCVGGPLTMMSSTSFAQAPLRWLQAITRHKATVSGGPNFAYQLCVDRITPEERAALDLSSWQVAFCGAEPIRADTLHRFAEAFAPCGFRPEALCPGYGLAEATLVVSTKAASTEPTVYTIQRSALERSLVVEQDGDEQAGRTFVGCGHPLQDHHVAIVDPESLTRCPPDRVGEIWVSGPSVSQGYWNRPEETARAFQAFIAETGEGPYLRTGDLGFLKDGELVITGRLKDLIIIHGLNYDPHDIEVVAQQSHPALEAGGGAAFSVPVAGEERLAIVHELRRSQRDADAEEVVRAIRHAVAENQELPVYAVALSRPGALPRTSSGKIQRYLCREAFLAGHLETIAVDTLPAGMHAAGHADQSTSVAPRTPLEMALGGIWATTLGRERIGIHDNFFELGGDSLSAARVVSYVQETFGAKLSLSSLFEAPTVAGMAARVKAARATPREGLPPIQAVDRSEPLPLSSAQAHLWFLQQIDLESPAYNIGGILRLVGPLDREALQRGFQKVLCRHEALRTTFTIAEGQPAQVVHPPSDQPIPLTDLRDLPPQVRQERAMQLARREQRQPFDLVGGPLVRAHVFQLDDREYLLALGMHHIVSDGRSLGVFTRELATLYEALSTGQSVSLPELPVQYGDYAHWQRQCMQGDVYEPQLAYWRQKLVDRPSALQLLTDRLRAEVVTTNSAQQRFVLSTDVTDALEALGRQEGTTLFVVLLSAFQALLSRYTGEEDICVGTHSANRGRPELEGLVGLFINTLVVRTDLSGDPSFHELLDRVHQVVSEALANQDVPFEMVLEQSKARRHADPSALFQAMFVLQDFPQEALQVPGLALGLVEVYEGGTPLDLTLVMSKTAGGLRGTLQYNADLFDAGTMARMSEHFRALLESAAAAPESRLSEPQLLTEAERHQVLSLWNRTAADYPADRCIHELFEVQAAQTPDAIAVEFADQRLTYSQLNHRANQLAHYLRRLGVDAEVLVGLCVERSVEMVVGLLGILKAGGAYVPVDPSYPHERLAFMLADTDVSLLLTQQALAEAFLSYGARVLCLDMDWPAIAREREDCPVSGATPNNVAYVIYTSGSTGRPKGVLLEHRGLCNVAQAQARMFNVGPADRVLQYSSISFDAATYEIVMALTRGAVLCLGTREAMAPGRNLAEFVRQQSVTTAILSPSVLAVTPHEDLPGLRMLMAAGEECPAEIVARWAPGRRFYNLYGPTETTIWATAWEARGTEQRPPIGRPIANLQTYVLDAHLQPAPIGVPGELHIGGVGLARGYLNRPKLTDERFIPNPFSSEPGVRLYRTGDLVRYLPDGNLDFLGRLDHQVKVRGLRIEPGEIESILAQHEAVEKSVVVARDYAPGDRRLVAYIIPGQALEPNVSQLYDFLRSKLPEYMVPSAFVVVQELPLTLSAKIDRDALPAPDWLRPQLAAEYSVPRTPIEEALTAIWTEVLGIERVGIHDSFFELGGHSLLATQVASRVREVFQVELPLRTIFGAPTVAGLAAQVEEMLREGPAPPLPPIEPISRDGPLPLSLAQERIWFLHQLDPQSSAYNICGALRLVGRLDREALEQTFDEIVRRHEAFRTTFTAVDGSPVQVVTPFSKASVETIDLGTFPGSEREGRAMELAEDEARRPFDLTRGPLLRVSLLRLGHEEHVLLFNMHHIVSDAWSLGLLTGEVLKLYNAYAAGEAVQLPPLSIQYADFAVWQRQWLRGEALEALLAYWRRQLDGAPALELPTDYPRPVMQRYRGALTSGDIPEGLLDKLKRLSSREGVTLFMTLLAAFKVLLRRYTGQEDIAIGVPIANRNWFAIEGVVGSFVNTLVMRTDLADNPTFRQLLQRVREVALGAYAHQDMPYAKLVAELQPDRDTSRAPLAQVMFNVVNVPMPPLELEKLCAMPLEVDRHGAQFDLNFTVSDTGILRSMSIEYNTDLFLAETARRMLGHYQNLLEGIVNDLDQRISSLPMLGEAEQQQLLVTWNDTWADYPADSTFLQIFEAQVERTPDAPALVFEGQELSYQALNRRANQIARHLQSLGVGPEVIVGVLLERSLDAVSGLLGVLKAGGAYLPLDPCYPTARLAFMLRDADVLVLLTQESLVSRLPEYHAALVCLDADRATIEQQSTSNPISRTDADSLAYVLHTSGSTGRPKGVLGPYRGMMNRFAWMWNTYPFQAGEICCQKTSLSFIDSIWELFGPLLQGVPTVIIPDSVVRDPYTLVQALAANRVTRIVLVPSLLAAILEAHSDLQHRLPELRMWTCSGESLSPELVYRFREAMPHSVLLNMYGSSEVAADVTSYDTAQLDVSGANVPIGRPIANTQTYILDRYLQPVPIGVPGELYIGGLGLARGYLDRPELTAESFIPHPFSSKTSERLYRTGDLARYLPSGEIELVGRRDHQIKIRGFRIELGEIEAVLRQHPAIGNAVVIALGENSSRSFSPRRTDRRLAAYLVVRENSAPSIKELRAFLGDKLPGYMIPSAFTFVDALPLTPNGKVDRRALAGLDQARAKETDGLVPPRDVVERQMVQIWEQVLGVHSIGVQDNFFELGGHSLLAVRLFAQVEEVLGVRLPIATLFRSPTVEQLCEAARNPGSSPDWKTVVPIQAEGSQPPLFCVHGFGGGVLGYADLARLLGKEQPFYGLQARGLNGAGPPHTRIEEMAAHYVEAVRTVRPTGPYCLGGYSFGGVVAFEMAHQLQAQGARVELLALFDTYAPLPPGAKSQLWRPVVLASFMRNLPRWLSDILRRRDGADRLLARIRLAARAAWPRTNHKNSALLTDAAALDMIADTSDLSEEHRRVLEAHLQALQSYRPQVYPGHVTLFRVPGMRLLRASDDEFGWGKLATGGVTVRKITGAHYDILEGPSVEALAAQLRDSLIEIRGAQPDDPARRDR